MITPARLLRKAALLGELIAAALRCADLLEAIAANPAIARSTAIQADARDAVEEFQTKNADFLLS